MHEDDDADELDERSEGRQRVDVRQQPDHEEHTTEEGEADLGPSETPGGAHRVAVEAPLHERHPHRDEEADDHRGGVSVLASAGHDVAARGHLGGEEHAEHAADDGRRNGGEEAEVHGGELEVPGPCDGPREEADDRGERAGAEDRPRVVVGEREGEREQGKGHHRSTGQPAGRPDLAGCRRLAEEPQRRGEDARGDPAERPGMDVGEQDLAAEVDEVGAVEDADGHRPHEHDHGQLEEEHDLPAKRMGGVGRRHLGHRFPPVPANGATIRAPRRSCRPDWTRHGPRGVNRGSVPDDSDRQEASNRPGAPGAVRGHESPPGHHRASGRTVLAGPG